MSLGKHKDNNKNEIRFYILYSIALKNLLSKRLRSALTVIGIMIGVGAVVFLASLSLGLHSVVDRQVIGSQSISAINVSSPNANTIFLDDKNTNTISQIPHVKAIAPAYVLAGTITYQGSQSNAVVYGANDEYINLTGPNFISGSHSIAKSNTVIVNTAMLNQVGQGSPKEAVGKYISVKANAKLADGTKIPVSTKLKIVGVVSSGQGAEIYMSSQIYRKTGAFQYGQLMVIADNRQNVPVVRRQIEGLGLTTQSPLDTLSQINNIFTIFTFVVIGFGGIGMVIAVLGMFNTMTISLIERTKEIGLMVSLGARRADIRHLLMLEAQILSIAGALGGIIVAGVIGKIIDIFLSHIASHSNVQGAINAFLITPLLVSLTILFIVILGFLVVLYPAKRAAQINPIEALRHD